MPEKITKPWQDGEPPWRVGRSVYRTLYLRGELVGMVDTRELAAEICEAMNERSILAEGVRLLEGKEWSCEHPSGEGCLWCYNLNDERHRQLYEATGGHAPDCELYVFLVRARAALAGKAE